MVLRRKEQERMEETHCTDIKDTCVMSKGINIYFHMIIVYFTFGMQEGDRKKRKGIKKEIEKFIE